MLVTNSRGIGPVIQLANGQNQVNVNPQFTRPVDSFNTSMYREINHTIQKALNTNYAMEIAIANASNDPMRLDQINTLSNMKEVVATNIATNQGAWQQIQAVESGLQIGYFILGGAILYALKK